MARGRPPILAGPPDPAAAPAQTDLVAVVKAPQPDSLP
jgi:hypothetical protein